VGGEGGLYHNTGDTEEERGVEGLMGVEGDEVIWVDEME
jgi:hypothetical protein